MLAELGRYFLGEPGAGVIHCQEDAEDLQAWVQAAADEAESAKQLGEAGEGIVFALYRDDYALGGGQAVDCKKAQGGRTVNQDKTVVFELGFDCLLQAQFSGQGGDEFDLCSGEVY